MWVVAFFIFFCILMQLMSLLFFVGFTNGSQAPFLWRQGLSLLSAQSYLLNLSSSSNVILTAVSPGDKLLSNKVKPLARLTEGMWRLWCSSIPVVSRAESAHQTRLQVLPAIVWNYLNLVAFLPLSCGASVSCVVWRDIRALHPSLLNPEEMLELIKEAHSLWRWGSPEQRNVGHG